MTGPAGLGREVFRVSGLGPGRVGSGRVGSSQEVFEFSRVGSGSEKMTRPDPTRPDPPVLTRSMHSAEIASTFYYCWDLEQGAVPSTS